MGSEIDVKTLPEDFDPQAYLAYHSDVAAAGMGAEEHYLRYGRAEGRAYRRSELGFRGTCSICGGTGFAFRRVLWRALIDEWQLAPHEAHYIDRQQGECCRNCGAKLRCVALSDAILNFLGARTTLREVCSGDRFRELRVLEINEAGTLSPTLRMLPHHTFAAYPNVDIHAMPYADGSFDIVVHGDTLEHVRHPLHALKECCRVLRPGGALAYTVPIVVERMSRDRTGLPKSFHGAPNTYSEDYVVHTEYGADAWTQPLQAGFANVGIHTCEFPAGIAFLARKS